MIVELICVGCQDEQDENYNPDMKSVGPLTLSEDKTQSQEYECSSCGILVRVMINTILEKK